MTGNNDCPKSGPPGRDKHLSGQECANPRNRPRSHDICLTEGNKALKYFNR